MSKIEVDAIDKQSGSTLTLGGSGTAVTLASGATQSGFGRTGTVDWQTSIKTSTITVVSGEGYFVDTTSGPITANLPAGSAGAIAAFRDYANTFDTNNLTISSNGSEKINGNTIDLTVNTEGESLTLVYADATKGWLVVNDGNNDAGSQAEFVAATGGTITTVCTNFKVHTFTGPGTFAVSNAGNAGGSNTISYMVVAGGAGGGNGGGAGGGGAGGFRESESPTCSYTQSPIAASGGLPVTATSYPVVVGGGGAYAPSGPARGTSGTNSVFTGSSTITSAGGGGGGSSICAVQPGGPGGSGGGGSGHTDPASPGGTGNTPPTNPAQGTDGGAAPCGMSGTGCRYGGGGGGGATVAGTNASVPPSAIVGGPGGTGATTSINGTPTAFAGGGGGGIQACVSGGNAKGTGGTGGGGAGGAKPSVAGVNGTTNTGGGGGAGGQPNSTAGGNGGSGIVIIRYKFQ
jgi:hypothetical protein